MANYNKVILVGNLTRDPQLSMLPSQQPVAEFGLAVNRRWTDRQTGQQREEACFIDCRCYGRQAETINQYMRKGQPILVEGRLQYATWEGKDGTRRSKHRVIVERFQFLGMAQAGGRAAAPMQAEPPAPPPQPVAPAAGPAAAPPTVPLAPEGEDEFSEPPPSAYDDEAGGEGIPF